MIPIMICSMYNNNNNTKEENKWSYIRIELLYFTKMVSINLQSTVIS